MALTAAERETVISIADDENRWTIHTSQRKQITQLLKNPQADILEDTMFQGSRMMVATIPANAITIRKATRSATSTGRKVKGKNCTGKKTDGSACGMVAVNGTGFCRHHQAQKKK